MDDADPTPADAGAASLAMAVVVSDVAEEARSALTDFGYCRGSVTVAYEVSAGRRTPISSTSWFDKKCSCRAIRIGFACRVALFTSSQLDL